MHHKNVCKHGKSMGQCRCPGTKETIIVPCPASCYKEAEEENEMAGSFSPYSAESYSFTCVACGALIAGENRQLHLYWHRKIDNKLGVPFARWDGRGA